MICMDRFQSETYADRRFQANERLGASSGITSEPLLCDSCNAEVSDRFSCYWDSDLKVGRCCLIHSEEAEQYGQDLCETVPVIAAASSSVEQFVVKLQAHLAVCGKCHAKRKSLASIHSSSDSQKATVA
jgi:hypothetical protein